MGYPLFAQRKLELDNRLNQAKIEKKILEESLKEFRLTANSCNKELKNAYELLKKSSNEISLNSSVEDTLSFYSTEILSDMADTLETSFTEKLSNMEKALEKAYRRQDTMVTMLQKQIEAVNQSEGHAIDREIPKFKGIN